MIVVFGVLIGILFREETHPEKKCRNHPGLEIGKQILSKISRRAESKTLRVLRVSNSDEN